MVRTPEPDDLARHLVAAGAEVQPAGPDTLFVTGIDLDRIGDAALSARIALHELSPHAGSLEDVFLALTTPTQTDATSPDFTTTHTDTTNTSEEVSAS
jgi:ABC-2 type transport system ATP-binding protein